MIQPMNLSHTHGREAKQYHHWNQKLWNITIAHATVQALHMLKEDASGSSRTVRSAKSRIVQTSTRDHPWIWQAVWQAREIPCAKRKWSDDDFSNHWQSLTYTIVTLIFLIYSWYSSRFALRFKKVTPSHHILSSHFTKGRFLCENNEIARKKEQVPDFGWKVAGLLLCLLVCESASCFFYERAGKPITDQYQSSV